MSEKDENNSIEDDNDDDDEDNNISKKDDIVKERNLKFDNGVLKQSKIEFVVKRSGNGYDEDHYYNAQKSVFDVLCEINNEMVELSNVLDSNNSLNKDNKYDYNEYVDFNRCNKAIQVTEGNDNENNLFKENKSVQSNININYNNNNNNRFRNYEQYENSFIFNHQAHNNNNNIKSSNKTTHNNKQPIIYIQGNNNNNNTFKYETFEPTFHLSQPQSISYAMNILLNK